MNQRDIAQILRLGAGSDLEDLFIAVGYWVEAEEALKTAVEGKLSQRLIDALAQRLDARGTELKAFYLAVCNAPGEAEDAAQQAVRRYSFEVAPSACERCGRVPYHTTDGQLLHRCEETGQVWAGSEREWEQR